MRVRFNCMMKETTRKKLHKIASQSGRSDSNMVEFLIDTYVLDKKMRIPMHQEEEDNAM